MKKRTSYLIIVLSILTVGCIKQIEKNYTGKTVAELDPTVLNANSTGVTYPIITRKPREGVPVATTDSTIRRISGTISLRVNLVGPHSDKDETIGYKIFNSPITTISFPATATGQTPTQGAGTLTVSTALAGTHYTTLTGTVTIPAKSSYGYINVQVLNAGVAAGQGRFVGIQLDSSGSVMPNPNYNKIGLVIDQR